MRAGDPVVLASEEDAITVEEAARRLADRFLHGGSEVKLSLYELAAPAKQERVVELAKALVKEQRRD